nr:putative B3 domain-containing protein Os04g0676650 isoform X1 [Physcomitrium patens]|eukprot:XP_024402135.1 putative B3 domain-containing protein Os04g0676650 isoform X1 [Physcomitrella patens]
MEESIAITWPQDLRGFGRGKLGDKAYLSFGPEPESSNLPTSVRSYTEFTTSDSSTGTTADCDYFDPFLQTDMWKELTPDPTADTIGNCSNESVSPILEQLLTCKDTLESQSLWGIDQQQVGMLPHETQEWTQPDCSLMDDWNQNFNCGSTDVECESSMQPTENQLGHVPAWMTEMPAGSYSSTSPGIISTANQLMQSSMIMSFQEDQQLKRPSCTTSGKVAAANSKAAARKHRIFLRQKSAPHHRNISHASGRSSSPRELKKIHPTKLPKEFLMWSNFQGRNMDSLRFLLHKFLQPSDVNNLGRIVISKREAETHLPNLAVKEGIFITMEDFDTRERWTFRYRFWPNSRSRMYLLENTGDFVRAHHLTTGDVLVLWRNCEGGTFLDVHAGDSRHVGRAAHVNY